MSPAHVSDEIVSIEKHLGGRDRYQKGTLSKSPSQLGVPHTYVSYFVDAQITDNTRRTLITFQHKVLITLPDRSPPSMLVVSTYLIQLPIAGSHYSFLACAPLGVETRSLKPYNYQRF